MMMMMMMMIISSHGRSSKAIIYIQRALSTTPPDKQNYIENDVSTTLPDTTTAPEISMVPRMDIFKTQKELCLLYIILIT
jgi:hypothetical protein